MNYFITLNKLIVLIYWFVEWLVLKKSALKHLLKCFSDSNFNLNNFTKKKKIEIH